MLLTRIFSLDLELKEIDHYCIDKLITDSQQEWLDQIHPVLFVQSFHLDSTQEQQVPPPQQQPLPQPPAPPLPPQQLQRQQYQPQPSRE